MKCFSGKPDCFLVMFCQCFVIRLLVNWWCCFAKALLVFCFWRSCVLLMLCVCSLGFACVLFVFCFVYVVLVFPVFWLCVCCSFVCVAFLFCLRLWIDPKMWAFWKSFLGGIDYVDHCTVLDVIHWRLISRHKRYVSWEHGELLSSMAEMNSEA